jgi:hypothetical protein
VFQDTHSDAHHCCINNTRIASRYKLSVLCHRSVSVEHVVSRDLHVVEDKESIVFTVVSIFRSNITNINAWKGLVCLHVSELHHERLYTDFLSIDD